MLLCALELDETALLLVSSLEAELELFSGLLLAAKLLLVWGAEVLMVGPAEVSPQALKKQQLIINPNPTRALG